jgi:hypothetical protein
MNIEYIIIPILVISISFCVLSRLNCYFISYYVIESDFFIFITLSILIDTDLSNGFKSPFLDSDYVKFDGYNGPDGLGESSSGPGGPSGGSSEPGGGPSGPDGGLLGLGSGSSRPNNSNLDLNNSSNQNPNDSNLDLNNSNDQNSNDSNLDLNNSNGEKKRLNQRDINTVRNNIAIYERMISRLNQIDMLYYKQHRYRFGHPPHEYLPKKTLDKLALSEKRIRRFEGSNRVVNI